MLLYKKGRKYKIMKCGARKTLFCNLALYIGLIISGCYPVSHIVVGESREPIHPSNVKVYADFPESYEKIAIIEASSDFSIKDISFEFSDQGKTDKALKRIKKDAASLGANGIVIEDLLTTIKQKQDIYEDDEGKIQSSTHEEKQKMIKAIAIFTLESSP